MLIYIYNIKGGGIPMKTIAERIREGMEIRNLKQVDIIEKNRY